jgi:hypothetical protein
MMMICRANLDAMGGRAVATIEAHAAAINKAVLNCQLLRKMPSIPPRGPMPLADMVGMSLAVELLFHSLTAVPRIKGQSHIQFDSIRKQWSTFTSAWESSPLGIHENSTFSTSATKVMITSCPTQQKWFGLMMRGAESRMGYTSQRQQPLGIGVISKLLKIIKEEAEDQEREVAREYIKVGAAVETAVCGSLRGSEVFMMELSALRRHIHMGREGTMPVEPMKAGIDLAKAPQFGWIEKHRRETGRERALVHLSAERKIQEKFYPTYPYPLRARHMAVVVKNDNNLVYML